MDHIAQPKDYWIAPKAIHISLNALGDANRIQCSVASGAVIMCYIYGTTNDGLGYDNGHQYRTWPISIAPTYFNTDTAKYVYAAIPKDQTIGVTAQVVFPSEQLDIYGKNASDEQIGSTDYFFIFLQGIISQVQEQNNTTTRSWAQAMDYGILDTDQARDAKVDDTAWYSYSHLTEIVTFLKEIVMNPGATFRNLFLGTNGGKELTSVATDETTPTNSTKAVVTPFYASQKYLSKKNNDTAEGKITFEQGADFGEFVPDIKGASIWKDEQEQWHVESDFLFARKKLIAKEVQIEKVSHIGGQHLLTAASMHCDFVVDKGGFWRCFFRRVGTEKKIIHNEWKVNDQAYVETFNLEQKEGGFAGNHYLWRLVVGVDSNDLTDTGTYTVDGEEVSAADYHFIDLSKTVCGTLSDEPKAGDDIVQLGYQGTDNPDRQNAIILAGAGQHSPYIYEIVGINSFALPAPETRIKPGDNLFTGKVTMQSGTKLPSGEDVENVIDGLTEGQAELRESVDTLDTGNTNMLRNTGFTGDYENEDVAASDNISSTTEIYSAHLKYWTYNNVSVSQDTDSASGMAATLDNGLLMQEVSEDLEHDAKYCVSLKAKGTAITISFAGHDETITLGQDARRVVLRITCKLIGGKTFKVSGSCTVMEIMLTKGTIPNTDWLPSPLDNNKALAYYQNLAYLANAIANASTTILGGLILTQMIRVGNYRNGVMLENGETGGMSGVYSSEQSPFLWGGGSMEQAFYTIAKYAQDPSYQPTEQEVAQMAKFVVTHGGRAILNDIVLRGYVYALGGYFQGEINALSGVFKSIHSPNNNFQITEEGNLICQNAKISGNMYMPLFEINDSNYISYLVPQGTMPITYALDIDRTGLNVQINIDTAIAHDIVVELPHTGTFNGAKMHLFNSSSENVTVRGGLSSIANVFSVAMGEVGIFLCYHASGTNYNWIKIN